MPGGQNSRCFFYREQSEKNELVGGPLGMEPVVRVGGTFLGRPLDFLSVDVVVLL